MKKLIVFFIVIIPLVKLSNTIYFTVPATILSNDNVITLKDIFPEVIQNRTVGYIVGDKTEFTKESLGRTLFGLLSIYYNNFEIEFESDIVTFIRNKEITQISDFDFESYIRNIVYDFDNELEILEINARNLPTNVSTVTLNRIYLNRDILYINITSRDNNNRSYYSTFNIKTAKYLKVLHFSENISRNTVITEKLTKEATINILEIAFNPILKEEFIFGNYYVTRNYNKGDIINPSFLRREPDIRVGDIITIRVIVGGIEVMTRGRVMKDSNFGEIVSVRNTETGILVTGLLMEGPYLLVNPGGV